MNPLEGLQHFLFSIARYLGFRVPTTSEVVPKILSNEKIPDSTLTRSERVDRYIDQNRNEYSEAYPTYMSDRFLSPMNMFLAALIYLIGCGSASIKIGNVLPFVAYLPFPLVYLLAFWAIRTHNRKLLMVSGRSLALAVSVGSAASYYVFYSHGKLNLLSVTYYSILASLIGIHSVDPSRIRSALRSILTFSCFFLVLLLIDHNPLKNEIPGVLGGYLLGLGLSRIIDRGIRETFVGEKNEQETRAILDVTKNATGWVRVSKKGVLYLDEQRSAALQTYFGKSSESRPEIYPYLLKQVIESDGVKKDWMMAMKGILGGSEFEFEGNSGLLPREFQIKVMGQTRILALQWSYTLHRDAIDKLLFDAIDITDQRELSRRVQAEKEISERTDELTLCGPYYSWNIIQGAIKSVESFKMMLNLNGAEVMRDVELWLHTLKGTSKSYGFRKLGSKVHEIETQMITNSFDMSPGVVSSLLENLNEELNTYRWILNERLKWIGKENTFYLSREEIASTFTGSPDLVSALLSRTRTTLFGRMLRDIYPEVGAAIAGIAKNSGEVARSLKKIPPHIVFSGVNARLNEAGYALLQNIIPHLLANSLDHGIESSEVRERTGKRVQGLISIECQKYDEYLVARWSDDGAGVDLDEIDRKAQSLFSSDELKYFAGDKRVELILKRKFSIKDELSEVSGMGLGLSAVREYVENAGGRVEVALGHKTSANRSSLIVDLHLPKSLFIVEDDQGDFEIQGSIAS